MPYFSLEKKIMAAVVLNATLILNVYIESIIPIVTRQDALYPV